MTQPPYRPPGPGYGARPPKPGVAPLAPIGLGELLPAVFGAYVRYWKVVLVYAGTLALVSTLLLLPATRESAEVARLDPGTSPEQVFRSWREVLVWYPWQLLVGVFVGTLAIGMLSPVAVSAMLGETLSLGRVWTLCRPQLGRLITLAVVYTLASLLGLALLVVPGVIVWTFWAFAGPALIVERCSLTVALRRSWSLVRGQFWRVLGILVLMSVIVGAVLGVVSAPVGLGATAVGSPGGAANVAVLVATGVVTGALGMPVTALTAAFLYIDTRIRRERYDLNLARSADL